MPLALEASLADICETSSISVESLQRTPRPTISDYRKDVVPQVDLVALEPLNIRTSLPTAMMELQQQFFLDFVFFMAFLD